MKKFLIICPLVCLGTFAYAAQQNPTQSQGEKCGSKFGDCIEGLECRVQMSGPKRCCKKDNDKWNCKQSALPTESMEVQIINEIKTANKIKAEKAVLK